MKVSPEPEENTDHPVQPIRTKRCDHTAEYFHIRLFLPSPPQHPQMRVIQLMGQEPENPFRMHIGEIKAIRGGAVGSHKEGQEMLHYLNDEVADKLLMGAVQPGGFVSQIFAEYPAAHADVGAVVRKTYIGRGRKYYKVCADDARLRSFATAFNWLRLKTLWQRCMYSCFASPLLQPERQGFIKSSL